MSDLGRTDAEWLAIAARAGFFLRMGRWLVEMHDRCEFERTQIVKLDDVNNNFDASVGDFTLSGMQDFVHTDEDNVFYVRMTGGVDPRTVSVYSAAGAVGLIAQGTGNAGTLVALTQQNSSGVSGNFPLRASVTVDADDRHNYQLFNDWKVAARDIFDGTETITGDDSKSLASANASIEEIRTTLATAIGQTVTLANRIGISDTAATRNNPVAQLKEWLQSVASTMFSERGQTDGSNNVTRTTTGIFPDMSDSMAAETTGATQFIVQRVPAATASTANTNNDGDMSISSHTPGQQMPVGRVTLECVSGLGNDGGGVEDFRVSFVSTEDDESKTYSRFARIKQSYVGEDGFGGSSGVTLDRVYTKTGDGADLNLAATSALSTTGENELNTASGVIGWTIVSNAANWDVHFFKTTSGFTIGDGDEIARAINVATAATFTTTAFNSSDITINWQVGSAPVTTTTGTVNFNYNRVANTANGQPDKYTIDVTETSSGTAAKLLGRLYNAVLNGTTSGSETLEDGRMARAGTFPAYVVEDN